MRGGDFDPGELLRSRAMFVHMPHRDHGIEIEHSRAVWELEGRLGCLRSIGTWRCAFRARLPCKCDHRDVAFARLDRLGRMRDMGDVGGAADFCGIHVARPNAEIVRNRKNASWRIRRAEESIDVALVEASIGQRSGYDFGVELAQGMIRGMAQRM